MLSAAAPWDDSTSLLRLVLGLVEAHKETEVPNGLRTQVLIILQQASAIAKDPRSFATPAWPEALTLARTLRDTDALAKEVEGVTDFSALNSALAHKLLEHLTSRSAVQD